MHGKELRMNTINLDIQELLDLEDIEESELRYSKKYGYPPFNVSTWNPSEYFSHAYLWNQIQLMPFDYIPYLYSYELDQSQLITTKIKLGGNNNFGCIIANTGTSAIALVTSVLKQIDVKRILVICPVYYSVLYNLLQKGIQITKAYLIQTVSGYRLPQKQIMEVIDNIDAIWLTSPIYNTGTYFVKDDIYFLKSKIPSRIILVCDDCFATNGMEMIRNFSNHTNYISVHDPLKQIMVNGLKFSCVLYSLQYEHLFEQWSDIICGSLSYSTVQSMNFFNSDKFDKIRLQLHQHFQDTDKYLEKIMRCFPSLSLDKNICYGHMRMCYVPNLPYDYLQNREKIYQFIEETGTSLIPGNRFHFSNTCGFCFRINYGRECEEFWDALIRIFRYLSIHS